MARKPSKTVPKNAPPSEAPKTLQKSILAAVPSAPAIMQHAQSIAALLPSLEREMAAAVKGGPVQLARAYVVLHRLTTRIKEELRISDSGSPFGPLVQQYKTVEVPQALEQAGISHVPLDEGYRVGVSVRWAASIKPDKKEEAYEWLRANGLADLVTATVNASTLSAAARTEIENNNREFPDDIFTVAQVPTTSVTQTK